MSDPIRPPTSSRPLTAALRFFAGPLGRERAALVLFLAVLACYLPLGRAGFIWDDDVMVTGNPHLLGLQGLREIWTTRAADICPLTLTLFWFEHALWGVRAWPYHLVDVLLQGTNAVLLWRVLRQLRVPGAWLGAALWALHPVEVESVAWVTETKNTLSGFFYLLTIFFFLQGLKAGLNRSRPGWRWDDGLTLLFAALALASKSSTVILPLVLGLCAWWVEGRWHWRHLRLIAPIFFLSLVAGAVSLLAQNPPGNAGPLTVEAWPQRLAIAGDAVWFYLGKLLWPHPLLTIYPRWEIDTGRGLSYAGSLAALGLLLGLWLQRGSWGRPCFFAYAYFLAALLPALGLFHLYYFRYSFVADHLQYLAAMGPLALAGAGFVRIAESLAAEKRELVPLGGAVILLVLGALSWHQARFYRSEATLWPHTLAWNSACWAGDFNLGTLLARQNRDDEAIRDYRQALALYPTYPEAHNNLGAALFRKGELDAAMAEYRAALAVSPQYADAHCNLGNVLLKKGHRDEAMAEYEKGLALNPYLFQVYDTLGTLLSQQGRLDEAVARYEQALAIDPRYARARYDLGNTLARQGRAPEAMAQYQAAIQLDPALANAHLNLGNLLFHDGETDRAVAEFEKALALDPNSASACNDLGLALFEQGKGPQAVTLLQRALQLDPANVEVKANLEKMEAILQSAGAKTP